MKTIAILMLLPSLSIFKRWLLPLALVTWLVRRSTKQLRLQVKDHVDDVRVPKRFKKQNKRGSATQSVGRINRLTSSGMGAGISSCFSYMRRKGIQISDEEETSFSWFKQIFLFVLLTISRLAFVKTMSAPAKDKLRSQGENVKPYVPRKTLVDLLSRAQFADWAYWFNIPNKDALLHCLRPFGFTSLQRYYAVSEPGRVGGYVAYNHDDKVVMIVARGSCTLSDAATDFAGLPVHQCDSESHLYEMRSIYSHEGVLKASNTFYEEHEEILQRAANDGYYVEIIGHSLGAAVASVVAGLAASRIPILQEEGRLQAFAFACPPCLNKEAAKALEPFVTSVIWNNDIVPSLGVDGVLSVCKLAACILSEKADSYKKRGYSLFQILGAVGSKLLLHCFGYGEQKLPEEEMEAERKKNLDLLWKIHNEKNDDEHTSLYVPGRVIHLWERTHFGQPTGQVNGCIAHGTSFLHLSFSVLTWGCISDHSLLSYKAGIQKMLDRIGEETEHNLRSFTSKRTLLSDLSSKPNLATRGLSERVKQTTKWIKQTNKWSSQNGGPFNQYEAVEKMDKKDEKMDKKDEPLNDNKTNGSAATKEKGTDSQDDATRTTSIETESEEDVVGGETESELSRTKICDPNPIPHSIHIPTNKAVVGLNGDPVRPSALSLMDELKAKGVVVVGWKPDREVGWRQILEV